MALGPTETAHPRAAACAAAERAVDAAVRASASESVLVPAGGLGVTPEEWDAHLKPKYLRAGWTSAAWLSGPAGGAAPKVYLHVRVPGAPPPPDPEPWVRPVDALVSNPDSV